MTLEHLIAKLEAADGPNFALDREIMYAAFNITPSHRSEGDHPAPYTASIDAALSLVPEGLSGSICFGKFSGAILWPGDPRKHMGEHRAKTPALALCIAALKAGEL